MYYLYESKLLFSTSNDLDIDNSSAKIKYNSIVSPNLLSNNKLGDYLAGLIEGDGTIVVPAELRNKQGKLQYPAIKIVFDVNDLPLAQKLIEILGNGTLNKPNPPGEVQLVSPPGGKGNYYILLIQDLPTLFKVINLINGRMRTPKIEALHRLIFWFNDKNYNNLQVPLYDINTKPLNETAWLSGFMEADTSFHFEYNININGLCQGVKQYMRLTQRRDYHRESLNYTSYLSIMTEIGALFDRSVKLIERKRKDYTELGYEIRTNKKASNAAVVAYFTNYPLFSSKYLNCQNWAKVHFLIMTKEYKTILGSEEIKTLKANHNINRTTWTWDHLNKFYTL